MVPMRKRRRDENGGESERAPPVSGFSSEECSAEEIKIVKSSVLAFVTLSTFEDLQRCSGSVGGGGKQAGVVSRILLFCFILYLNLELFYSDSFL